jgi:hypothetical protein
MATIKRLRVDLPVVRLRDGATGRVVRVETSSWRRPVPGFKALYVVRLDDAALAARAGGDMVGDAGWVRTYFGEGR